MNTPMVVGTKNSTWRLLVRKKDFITNRHTALGAAMVISGAKVEKKFLKENFALKKPIIQLSK